MNDLGAAVKAAADFGAMGLLAILMVLIYRLVRDFGSAFIQGQSAQTAAMAQQAAAVAGLVETVKDGQKDQRDVLMAVTMLAEKIDQHGRYLEAIENNCRNVCRLETRA